MQRLFSSHWKARFPVKFGIRGYGDVSATTAMRVLRDGETKMMSSYDGVEGKNLLSQKKQSRRRIECLSKIQHNSLFFSWSECVEVIRMCVVDCSIHESEWYLLSSSLVVAVALRVRSTLQTLRVVSATRSQQSCEEEYVWDVMGGRQRVALLAQLAVLLSHQPHSASNALHFTFTLLNDWRKARQTENESLDEEGMRAFLQNLNDTAEKLSACHQRWRLVSVDASNRYALYCVLQPFLPAIEEVYTHLANKEEEEEEERVGAACTVSSALLSLEVLRDTIPIFHVFHALLPEAVRRDMARAMADAINCIKSFTRELVALHRGKAEPGSAIGDLLLRLMRCGGVCSSLLALPRGAFEDAAFCAAVRSFVEEILSDVHYVSRHLSDWRDRGVGGTSNGCRDSIVAGFVLAVLRQFGDLPFCDEGVFGEVRWDDERHSLTRIWDECVHSLLSVYMFIPEQRCSAETWCSIAQAASNVVNVRRARYRCCSASKDAYLPFPTLAFAEFLLRQNPLLLRKGAEQVSLKHLAWSMHLGGELMVSSSCEERARYQLIILTVRATHSHASRTVLEMSSSTEDNTAFEWLALLASTAICVNKLERLAYAKKVPRQFEEELIAHLQLIVSLCSIALFGNTHVSENGTWANSKRSSWDSHFRNYDATIKEDGLARQIPLHMNFQFLLQGDVRKNAPHWRAFAGQRKGTERITSSLIKALVVPYSLALASVVVLSYHANTLLRHFPFSRSMVERLLSLPLTQAVSVLHREFCSVSMDGLGSFLHWSLFDMGDQCGESDEGDCTFSGPTHTTKQLSGGVALSVLFVSHRVSLRFKYYTHVLQMTRYSAEEQTRRLQADGRWKAELHDEVITALELLGKETVELPADCTSTNFFEVLDLGGASGNCNPLLTDLDCFAGTLTRFQALTLLEVLGCVFSDVAEQVLLLTPQRQACVSRAAAVVVHRALETDEASRESDGAERCVPTGVSPNSLADAALVLSVLDRIANNRQPGNVSADNFTSGCNGAYSQLDEWKGVIVKQAIALCSEIRIPPSPY